VIANRTDSTRPPELPTSGDDQETLATISVDYPGWETWGGALAGLLYAKRSNPQYVVRSTTIEGLRAEIERVERQAGLRE
jgi:hypothetical protein